jgi:hypothetical protein
MIIHDYPSEESYWKHKLHNTNYWLKKYPTSKTQKKRKAKCENMLTEVFNNERNMKLSKIRKIMKKYL